MKWKVCGMRDKENISAVAELRPDFMGFIFYSKSKRYVEPASLKKSIREMDASIKKVGVFVDEEVDEIVRTVKLIQLDYVQLHGHESVEVVRSLSDLDIPVIKAFHINETFDWEITTTYEGLCHSYLFDTAGLKLGGNGLSFDWKLLANYYGKTPFFLSGGIGTDMVPAIKKLNIPNLVGVDVNSRFELIPGMKDVNELSIFKNRLLL